MVNVYQYCQGANIMQTRAGNALSMESLLLVVLGVKELVIASCHTGSPL